MPLSTQLAREGESLFAHPGKRPEMRAMEPLLRIQLEASALPDRGRLLAERIGTRRGMPLFLFPFAGRAVHEGMAAMIALRWRATCAMASTWESWRAASSARSPGWRDC
ncbi:hypothetical protein G6F40_016733 [Rhizopus arrhizus]|nr:hypothetical protein G6F40_016733 [Rhizopus arrhizus]